VIACICLDFWPILGPWGTILESFWVLGSHLGALGAPWDPLRGLGGILGVLMGAIEELLGGSWGPKGRQNRSKNR